MANWAIVIGIDSYWTERACLKGAVRDAMHMQEWLVDPRGGNVPEENVKAVLSPLDGPDDATNANIIEAIADLLRRSEGKGERLYFFYAGHGPAAPARSAADAAVHPLRHVSGPEGTRAPRSRQRARCVHRGVGRRPEGQRNGEGVVGGKAAVRGSLGAPRRLCQEDARRRSAQRRAGACPGRLPNPAGCRLAWRRGPRAQPGHRRVCERRIRSREAARRPETERSRLRS